MTKFEMVIEISRETKLKQVDVAKIVQSTLDQITAALVAGERIELRDFGVFEIQQRQARVGRNPRVSGSEFQIPARSVVKFKAGKRMREETARHSPIELEGVAES